MEVTEKHEEVINAYITIVETNKSLPTYKDFLQHNISRDMIRSRFGGIKALHYHMQETSKDVLDDNLLSIETVFSEDRSLKPGLSKRYIVTTAVADSPAHEGFLKSLKNYSKHMNAQIVIMPCESSNSFELGLSSFDPLFNDPDFVFVREDVQLNDNISLCSIQVSAKQLRPITGLSRLGNREGSYVFASPKQFLEYVPAGHKRGHNYSIMTTGACTLPNYKSERFASKRVSYIADQDHKIGAVIIEIVNERIFHFRQIQADDYGSFIDLGIGYHSDGEVTREQTNVIFGDLHGVKYDVSVVTNFVHFLQDEQMEVAQVFLHDVFDGYSISHHVKDIGAKWKRVKSRDSSLSYELRDTFLIINYIERKLNPTKLNIVKSNHDEFLSRYLMAGNYVNDPENHYVALKIAVGMFEGEDTLKKGLEYCSGYTIPSNWHFLTREDSVKIGGVECAAHGDLGLNGARPSLTSLEKSYGDCVVGHSHSAAIHRGVFRVGTMSELNMGYNKGPSSWTHTCCLLYENGQRQLINYVDGYGCKLKD